MIVFQNILHLTIQIRKTSALSLILYMDYVSLCLNLKQDNISEINTKRFCCVVKRFFFVDFLPECMQINVAVRQTNNIQFNFIEATLNSRIYVICKFFFFKTKQSAGAESNLIAISFEQCFFFRTIR